MDSILLLSTYELGRQPFNLASPLAVLAEAGVTAQTVDTSFAPLNRNTLPPLKHYAHLEQNGQQLLAGYVEASRGCLHTCLHCPITPIYNGRFFILPQEIVLADIAAQVEMGAKHITFGDPDFMNGPGHSLKIVQAMRNAFPQLTFDVTIKIEHILKYRRHMVELKQLGCVFVVSAVETFSNTVLEKLNKGHTYADIDTALAIMQEIDLPLRPSLVAFTPWGTLEDYLDMLEQIEALGLIEQIDPVQYSIRLLVPPHSALIDQPDSNVWLGPLDAPKLTYHWLHPNPQMDVLHRRIADLAAAAQAGEDPRATFYRIKSAAYAIAQGRTPGGASEPDLPPSFPPSPATPKLTENWFC